MSNIGNIKELEKGIKKIFFSCENIFFHNKEYRIKTEYVNVNIYTDPSKMSITVIFFLIAKDKNTKNIITEDNYMNESREGGKISFDNRIYNCFNFNIEKIKDYKEYSISCGFRISFIDFNRKGMKGIIDAGEYYDFNERINIPFTRFEIMEI